MPRKEKYFLMLAGLFIGALVICNIVTFKLTLLWDLDWPILKLFGVSVMIQAVGILPYPVTFLVTDLISEVYGRKRANYVVFTGLIVSVFILGVIALGKAVPPLPKNIWNPVQGDTNWHLERVNLKLNLTPAEKTRLDQFLRTKTRILADLRGGEKGRKSAQLEKQFLSLLSPDNRERYLAMKGQRARFSRPYFINEEDTGGEDPKNYLGQRYLYTYFEEFFLVFPKEVPVAIRKKAIEHHQNLNPVLPFQTAYDAVFGQSVRAIFASMVAYLIAQLIDVRIFHFWKKLTKGRHLWLRNNGSTFLSQVVDTVLVMTILFYGVFPTETLVRMIWAGIFFKWCVAAIDTPFAYLGVAWFRKKVPEAFTEGEEDLGLSIRAI